MKMNRLMKGIAAAVLVTVPNIAAAAFSLPTINQTEYEKIVKELSSNFYYTTVSGASSLGKKWGFELGLVGGITDIPDIHTLVKRSDPGTSLDDYFPHGNLLARLTTPFYGLTVEAAAIPSITASDAKFSQYGGAVMWTITDVFLTDLPVALATKAYYKTTKFSYSQTINNSSTGNTNVNADIELDDTIYGAQAIVSKKLLGFIEPYASVGYTKADGDLTISSAVPAATFLSTGTSISASPTSMQLMAGVDVQLGFFSLGAEVARTYERNSYTGRLSFRF